MTVTIAMTGKSGSGKTTLVKAFLKIFKEYYPDKSILLFDNDLSAELGHTFNKDVRNTVYGIRSGKHEYKTGVPSRMTKQEYIEWALEDIVVNLEENVDLMVSWLIGSKDCRCPITKQINDALVKFFKMYDFVIFDCEFDLKYLNQLVDIPIDLTIITTKSSEESIHLAKRIKEYSAKYSTGGQIGVILNKVRGDIKQEVSELLKKYDLDILGVIPKDKNLKTSLSRESLIVVDAIKQFYSRLNLPQSQERFIK